MEEVTVPGEKPVRLLEWKVKVGDWIKYGVPVAIYRNIEDPSTGVRSKEVHLKSRKVGCVTKLLLEIGQVAKPGCPLLELESCSHPIVMKDMCAECGQDLRLLARKQGEKCARVSMVHNVPELKISAQQAEELAKQDVDRLHKMRKLVLLVDLDQTLIHTTQNQLFAGWCQADKNSYTFHLHKNEPTLYTKIRPHCRDFLEKVSSLFELHIVTFGSRQYAHKIAEFVDPDKKYFANRILSRDECINPMKKSGNLRHLFPCGDSMVCIIDDRDDVWSGVANLVQVKKYSYFPGSGDINSPDKLNSSRKKSSPNKRVGPERDGSLKDKEIKKGAARKRKSDEESKGDASASKLIKTDHQEATEVSDKPSQEQEASPGSAENDKMKKMENEADDGTSDSESDSKGSSGSSQSSSASTPTNSPVKTDCSLSRSDVKQSHDHDSPADNANKDETPVQPISTDSCDAFVNSLTDDEPMKVETHDDHPVRTISQCDSAVKSKPRDDDVTERKTQDDARDSNGLHDDNPVKSESQSDTRSAEADSLEAAVTSCDGTTKSQSNTNSCDAAAHEARPADAAEDERRAAVESEATNGSKIAGKKHTDERKVPDVDASSGTETGRAASKPLLTAQGAVVPEDTDDYLKFLLRILTQIHVTYYDAYEKFHSGDFEHSPDIRGVVPFLRSKILFGCHLIFTAVVPNNFKAAPHQHRAYIVAKQLGAVVDTAVTKNTTHLVGGKKGTAKYQECLKIGKDKIKFVSLDWLWTCSERWEKVPEKSYPILAGKNWSNTSSREGTPPVVKGEAPADESSPATPTYNALTGKLVRKVKDPRFEFMVSEAVKRKVQRKRITPLYSSLIDPEVVVPLQPVDQASKPTAATSEKKFDPPKPSERVRKPSMAEVMGIQYSLSSNDFEDMDKEVDDLMNDEDDDEALGTVIDRPSSSSSSEASQPEPSCSSKNPAPDVNDDVDDSSSKSTSSEEEFDHMAELLDHEMHYDEDDEEDLDNLD